MRENPYKRLPPIERKQDGMTPAQRKQENALIRWECTNYEDGNCMPFDDGDTHTQCRQLKPTLPHSHAKNIYKFYKKTLDKSIKKCCAVIDSKH